MPQRKPAFFMGRSAPQPASSSTREMVTISSVWRRRCGVPRDGCLPGCSSDRPCSSLESCPACSGGSPRGRWLSGGTTPRRAPKPCSSHPGGRAFGRGSRRSPSRAFRKRAQVSTSPATRASTFPSTRARTTARVHTGPSRKRGSYSRLLSDESTASNRQEKHVARRAPSSAAIRPRRCRCGQAERQARVCAARGTSRKATR